jgi:hypothetical protein
MYLNIQKGSLFNQLINSGLVHPTGVLIVPFIGSVAGAGFGDSQWKSPFDTCPATTSPCSLTIHLRINCNLVTSTSHLIIIAILLLT